MFRNLLKITNRVLFNYAPFVMTRPARVQHPETKNYFDVFEKMDYVRMMTLNLIVNELKENEVRGELAELGVYQGNFARFINKSFPEKKLYLFDTFEGFSSNDFTVAVETEIKDKVIDSFNNTSVEAVLGVMPFPEKCIIKKGLFPGTAEGCQDETFSFVSIDADLYKPIYEGLVFFYPRLQKGGYIMVHDYNNKEYKGAKLAVRDFAREFSVPYSPVADGWGSVVICK